MILVYKYGTHSRVRLPEAAFQQLHLAHQMRNLLVETQLTYEQDVKDLWSTYPQVAEIEIQLEEVDAQVAELLEKTRIEHQEDRTRTTRSSTAAALREARKKRRELRANRRAEIGVAYLTLKPQLEILRENHKIRTKEIRQNFSAQGLYWGTYNSILDHHRVSVNQIKAARALGRAARLKFHSWSGDGTLTVQLQRGANDPVRSPDMLADGDKGKWRNVLQVDTRTVGRDRPLRWSLGGHQIIEVPITVHRPLPPDCDVVAAQLICRRIGTRLEISVALTINRPDPKPAQGTEVALHLGWRKRSDDSVRVATWATPVTTQLDVPAALREVVVSHGSWGEVILPARWLEAAERPPTIASQRDRNMTPVQERLAAWLDENPQLETETSSGLTGGDVRKWRSPRRLASLILRWRDNPPEGLDQELMTLLNAWRQQDKHLWNWHANLTLKLTRRRDDAFKNVAAWLATNAGVLVLDDTDLAALRRRPDAAEDDPAVPSVVADRARARAAFVAPGRLRQIARTTCLREGLTVVEVSSADLSRTCPACHIVGQPDPRYAAAAVVQCPSCDHRYDQDSSAVRLNLERERSSSTSAHAAALAPRSEPSN